MNKKVNRYTLAQVVGIETRKITSTKSLNNLLSNIDNYNSKGTNPYFLGEIKINSLEKIVSFKKYKKITMPKTIEEIDKITVKYKSGYELKELYNLNLQNIHPLEIVYRYDKQIKSLPVIYDKDKKYLDREFVKNKYLYLGRDLDFVKSLVNNKLISASARNYNDFDELYVLRDSLKYNLPETVSLAPMHKFYMSFITKNKEFNYFNFRMLGLFLKDYLSAEEQEIELEEEKPEYTNQTLGQMIIPEFANDLLRDFYEELQISMFDGTLEEAYQKKLLPKHKTTK